MISQPTLTHGWIKSKQEKKMFDNKVIKGIVSKIEFDKDNEK